MKKGNDVFKKLNNIFDKDVFVAYTISSIVILLLIFLIDYFNGINFLINKLTKIPVIMIGVCLITILIILYVSKYSQIGFNKVIKNSSMGVSYLIFIISLCYLLLSENINNLTRNPWLYSILSISSLIVLICLITLRLKKPVEEAKGTVVDLYDLYKGTIKEDVKLPIIISDEEATHDLLERRYIIDDLKNTILNNDFQKGFVIGINGDWGSGKTTLVKIALKELEEKIISIKFDLWIYNNTTKMLVDLLEQILSSIGKITFNNHIKKLSLKIARGLCDSIPYGKGLKELFNNEFDYKDDVRDLKNELIKEIKKNVKKVVVHIDNMDRASNDVIINLFKIISVVMNIQNLIFIVDYDGNRLDNVFNSTMKINSKYKEKIIGKEIIIPDLNEEVMEGIINTCTNNIFKIYESKNSLIKLANINLNVLTNYIQNKIPDLRTFKRLINSVISPSLMGNHGLDYYDFCLIKIIEFLDIELFNYIKSNIESLTASTLYYADRDRYNQVINNIGNKYPKSINVVNELFNHNEHKRDKGIWNVAYAKLYFTLGTLKNSLLHDNVLDCISDINKNTIDETYNIFMKFVDSIKENLSLGIQYFENSFDSKSDGGSRIYLLLINLSNDLCDETSKIKSFKNVACFKRLVIKLVSLLDEELNRKYLYEDLTKNVKYLNILDFIVKNGNNPKYFSSIMFDRLEKYKKSLDSFCNRILNDKISVFNNFSCEIDLLILIEYAYNNSCELIYEYTDKFLSEKTVYKFLAAVERVNTYGNNEITSESFYSLFNNDADLCIEKKVEELININLPTTKKEKELVTLFEKCFEDKGLKSGAKYK